MNLDSIQPDPPRYSLRQRLALTLIAASVALSACGAATEEGTLASPRQDTASPAPPSTSSPVPTAVTLPDTEPSGAASFLGPIMVAEVDDISIGYRQFGRGEPLVLVMGSTATMTVWDMRLLQALAERSQVTIFDNPGVASSMADPARALSIESMAQDTVGLMDRLGIEQADILGWSMGAYVALTIAIDDPDRVDRLILAAGDAGGSDSPRGTAKDLAPFLDPAASADVLLGLLFPATPTGEGAKSAFLASYAAVPQEQITPDIARRQAAAIEVWAQGSGRLDRLGDITQPVLITHGDVDRVVPVENAEILARHIPQATLRRFPDAGHGFLFQDVGPFSQAVTEFLAP